LDKINNLQFIGKIFIGLSFLNLFRREKGPEGFGGHETNAWEILMVSLFFLFLGLAFIGYSKYKNYS